MTYTRHFQYPQSSEKNVLEYPGAEGTDNQWLLYRYVKLYRKITNRKITPLLNFCKKYILIRAAFLKK